MCNIQCHHNRVLESIKQVLACPILIGMFVYNSIHQFLKECSIQISISCTSFELYVALKSSTQRLVISAPKCAFGTSMLSRKSSFSIGNLLSDCTILNICAVLGIDQICDLLFYQFACRFRLLTLEFLFPVCPVHFDT